ncbi:hypothetical protein V6N13_004960 [Hibiscus sabdariffa]
MVGVESKELRRRSFDIKSDPTRRGTGNGKEVKKVGLSKSGVQGKNIVVAAQASVLEGKTALNPEKHAVVEVVDVERAPIAQGTKGRMLPMSIKGGTSLGSTKKSARLPMN